MEQKFKISHRSFETAPFVSGSIDEEKRTVDISFSSETPARQSFGTEILEHDIDSVDLSRLNSGAAVFVDHGSDQIGVVEKAEIREKRGFARLRFSKNQRASEIYG